MDISKKQKNGEIELFRFIFSFIIMLRHSNAFIGTFELTPFPGGALAVEFFFIVSGYLLMATLDKSREACEQKTILSFLRKKISSFYPEYILAWLIAFGVTAFSRQYSFSQCISKFIDCFWSLFLVQQTGLNTGEINSPAWYLSAMLICMAILYPLLQKHKKAMQHIIAPFLTVLILGYMCQSFDSLRNPTKWLGFFYKGTLRGMAEICLGISIYQFSELMKRTNFNFRGTICITLIKWICYIAFIKYLTDNNWDDKDYFYTFVLAIAILFSFSQKCIETRVFNNKYCYYLGDLSLTLYLCHHFYAKAIKICMEGSRIRYQLLVYIFLSFLTANFVMFTAKKIRKGLPSLKNKAISFFVSN